MATLCSSVVQVLLGLILGMTSSALLCSSLIDLVSFVSCPPILWSSWSPMTTIEYEFFFFWVTLGITCRIKWVVAALRGLWPRGMFRLMELMFSLVGLLGFSLVSSSFGLLNFKTSPSSVFIFHPFEIYFLYFFWETSPSLVSSFSLAVTLLQWAMQRRLPFFLLEVRFSFIFLFFLLFQCRYKPW